MSTTATREEPEGDAGLAPREGRTVVLGPYLRWVLVVASTGAGAIHFAFTPDHFGEYWIYGLFFVALGWAQLAWAFALALKPSRLVLYLGLLNGLVVAAWLASRTIGVGFGPLATSTEAFGFPDTLSSMLELVIVAGSGVLLWKPEIVRRPLQVTSIWPGLTAAVTLALIVVLSASLTPSLGGHSHDEHDAGAAGSAHDMSHAAVATTGRKVDAAALIAATKRNLTRWANVEQAKADGFQYIHDGPFEHYVNWAWVAGPGTLNPRQPESLVYVAQPDGSRRLVSAMYIAPWGTPFDKVPNVAEKPWHSHPDLCWDENMIEVGSTATTGKCTRGKLVVLPPMLHVWIIDNACGPFANLEDSGDVGARILQGQDPNANGKKQTGGCHHPPHEVTVQEQRAGSIGQTTP